MANPTLQSVEFDPFQGLSIERVIPATEAQREVWLADRLSSQASLAFNESVTLQLTGEVDEAVLIAALHALAQRHDSLRGTFSPDGTEQLINAQPTLDVPVFDLRALPDADAQATLDRAVGQTVLSRFDLEQGPLWRAALYRMADDDYRVLMTAHHIVCDGWSWGLLVRDLGQLYAEKSGRAPAPDAAPSYADYVAWEIAEGTGAAALEHERFWLSRFTGSLPVLDLPTDRPRAAVRTFDSGRIDHRLDAALVSALRKSGARWGASSFATLFGGFAALLQRLTGQSDLVVGVPSAGQSASGMTGLVGHCVNLLAVRISVDPLQRFQDFVRAAAGELLDAFEHQTLTFGTLLRKLPVQRDPSRLPLVSVMFNLDQAPQAGDRFAGLAASFQGNPRAFENFELFVNAVPAGEELRLECQYNTGLFDATSVRRWLVAFEELLRDAVLDPTRPLGELNCLAPDDLPALRSLQPPATPFPAGDLMHTAFIRQAQATPDRVALRTPGAQLSYGDLERRSSRLARALRERGIGRGERVGLCLGRDVDMVVAVLGVLKAGGTYVPLDPGFPAARLAYYAEDAQLSLLLLDAAALETAPMNWRSDAALRSFRIDGADWQSLSDAPLPPSAQDADPESAAYVIYTSGSTGKPKGVCVPHRAVVNFLASMRGEPGLDPADRFAAVTTLSFDIAVLELMLPLTLGAQVIIVPRAVAADGNALHTLLETSGATAMQATPSLWRLLLDTSWRGGSRFKALVGGESCPPDLARELLNRAGDVWNMYGPTETTIWSTLWKIDAARLATQGMSIGRPIANTRVWILDANRRPCPWGVRGEICIGGAGVTLGYLDRPELTRERYIADPVDPADGARLYRTGDRGRWRNDGLLEHLGRLDFQVKVRGYRIELGEIEACCAEFPKVAQSVVLAREDQPGDVRLVAYLVPAGPDFDATALRSHLRAKLPDYMVPQHLVPMASLPLLPNGKIDRAAFPPPDQHRPSDAIARVAPRDDIERRVMTVMETVLSLPGLGVHDDFFMVGGHSLLAARFTSQINRDFELNLPLSTLFQAPTTERFAAAVRAARDAGTAKRPAVVHEPDRRSAPLTPMQDRMRFVEELQPGRLLYNTPSAHRLTGPMNVVEFERALREIVRRQSSLRTSIGLGPAGNGHVQVIAESVSFELPLVDLSPLPAAEREAEVLRRMQQIVDTPLDIHRAPLFRTALFRLAEHEHVFLFMPHHLIWDGWSFDLLYEEMAALYGAFTEGRPNPLPSLPMNYGDYAQWYIEWMECAEFKDQLRYWKQRFAQAPMPAAPRLDKPRRAGMTGEGATEWVQVDKELTERLRDIARSADATLNMLTLAVYTAMMTSVVDAASIIIGLPVRGRLMADAEPVMGFFNNLLPVQFQVDAKGSVIDFVKAVRHELMEVLARQDVPFERLATEPEVAAVSQRVGLYQALFSFQDARDRKRQWGKLKHQSILIFQKGATEDLGLWLMEVPHGLEGGFTYNADIYERTTAMAFRERYLELLRRLADDPAMALGQLTAPGESAAARYLVNRGAPAAPAPGAGEQRGAAAAVPSADVVSASAVSASAAPVTPPLSTTETELIQVWKDLLALPHIEVTDNFFNIGGYSLLAMALISRIEIRFGKKISPATLLEAPTVRQLSTVLDQLAGRSSLVRIRSGGGRPSVFFVHDADGEILLYRNLSVRLDPAHPVYGLQPHASDGHAMLHTRMSDLVDYYLAKIRSVQAHGPYVLGGLCAGGMIAFEIALRLQAAGERVATVALIDAAEVTAAKKVGLVARKRLGSVLKFLSKPPSEASRLPGGKLSAVGRKFKRGLSYELGVVREKIEIWIKVKLLQRALDNDSPSPRYARTLTVREILSHAEGGMTDAQKFRGDVLLFRATRRLGDEADEPFMDRYQDALLGWGRRVAGSVVVIDIPAGHSTMLQESHVALVAAKLQEHIDAALSAPVDGGV